MTTTPQYPDAVIAFIRARLDEDEGWGKLSGDRGGEPTPESQARVLAEVAAKRALIAGYETVAQGYGPWDGCGDWCEWNVVYWALQHVAYIWHEHPDYRQEWKP